MEEAMSKDRDRNGMKLMWVETGGDTTMRVEMHALLE
jgi:hypothetical protein